MPDERKIRKKVLLRLLGSPFTIAPFMLGMTALTAVWALDWTAGIGLFGGLSGILASFGVFTTRLLLGGEKITREALAEVEQEERADRQKALDELDRRLTTADDDPRPETALRDLRALMAVFEEAKKSASGWNASSAVDIHAMVNQLFDQCVQSLEKTEKLWETARQLHTPAARKPILNQREKIIDDIQASIKQLSDTLVGLQNLEGGSTSNAELKRIRDELDQSLAVAKTVEERISNLVKEADLKGQAQLLQNNSQEKG